MAIECSGGDGHKLLKLEVSDRIQRVLAEHDVLTSSGNAALSELILRSSDLIKLRFAPSSLAIRKSCA